MEVQLFLNIIATYCVCDDLLKLLSHVDDSQCKMETAEIMTVGIVAGMFFGGNVQFTRHYLKTHRYIPKMLSHSRLHRRLLTISPEIWQAALTLLRELLSCFNPMNDFVVDSFPVPACLPCRSWRCKLYQGKEYLGYCASKKLHYYGLKVHMIISVHGLPMELLFTPASCADITALREMNVPLPEGATLYGDRAYNSKEYETNLMAEQRIHLVPQRKRSSKRPHNGALQFLQMTYRRSIETVFSQITRLFPRSFMVRSAKGLEMRVFWCILAYTIKRYCQVTI